MPRCPDCNKFASLDTDEEPEIDNLDVDEDGVVTAAARIVNKCADCGTELTEANFDLEQDCSEPYQKHLKEKDLAPEDGDSEAILHDKKRRALSDHRLSVIDDEAERTEERRKGKDHYGVKVTYNLKCSCGDVLEDVEPLEDDTPGGGMDELN